MPVTLAQLDAVSIGDAIYLTTHPLTVRSIRRAEGFIPVIQHSRGSFPVTQRIADDIRRIVPANRRRKHHTRAEYAFVNTDGGRRVESFEHETNDCTVRALALATGSTYAAAHAHMAAHGRKARKGAHVAVPYAAAKLGGFECAKVQTSMMPLEVRKRTFGQWLESGELPARCVVIVPKHAIAVVDGKVCDAFKVGSRRTIQSIWAFRPAPQYAAAASNAPATLTPPESGAVVSSDAPDSPFRKHAPYCSFEFMYKISGIEGIPGGENFDISAQATDARGRATGPDRRRIHLCNHDGRRHSQRNG